MTVGIVEFIQGFSNGFFDLFFNFISFLGEKYTYIAVISFIYWIYNKKLGEILVITLGFSAVFNNILKEIIAAPRPYTKYAERIENVRKDTATGNSFPSGHTQNFTAILFAEGFHIKKQRFFVIASVLTGFMMLSRMYLGAHFLEDVIAAVLLGIATAYGITLLYTTFEHDIKKLHKLYLIALVVLFPLLFVFKDHDFFTGMGLLYGVVFALVYERKYVNFTQDITWKKKLIRYAIGLVILLGLQVGLEKAFDLIMNQTTTLENYFDFLRYVIVGFVGFGLYPALFTKYNF